MSRRKIAASNIRDVDLEAYQSVNDYLDDLVAFAQEIEARLEHDMLLIPQPVPAALPPAEHEISPDRRSSQRTLTIYRLVQIDSGGDRGFARCRNISDSGVRLELSMPLEMGAAVEIAFSPSNVLPGRVVWKVDHSCGIAFNAEVDSAAVLSRSAAELHGNRARPFRLNANLPARVSSDGKSRGTTVMDISQRGVKLTHDGSFHRGMSIRVVLASGAEREGVVQWVKGDTAGVYFIEPFSVDELGSIRAL
ncbi:PilZ domain-containing protein [Novosphingobium sp. G106]|uniref:PilZ domain-containing protein n=1 Tax=Novosphingobium sp. G106 TaxID=2849500 RepID=UPI001C2D46CE|nr:PilZ domain-containing protein [Novosphingobium sp. G106]MBV1691883.1 PilZ domain-containing protein [Novosphingobium sp. G106]